MRTRLSVIDREKRKKKKRDLNELDLEFKSQEDYIRENEEDRDLMDLMEVQR